MAPNMPNPAGGDRGARGTRQLRKHDNSPTSTAIASEQVIVVEPVGRRDRFAALLDDRVLVASSRTPLLDAARVLLAEGHDPSTIITMKHKGSDTECLRARLGVAAGLTVEERDSRPPRFVRWKPLHVTDGSTRTAEDDAAATPLAEAAE